MSPTMKTLLTIHIIAGALSLVFGYIALYSGKGASLHRKAGMVFVYAMLTMATFGLIVAIGYNVAPMINAPAALLTLYLVVTSVTTVRPLPVGSREVQFAGILIAAGVAVASLTFAAQTLAGNGVKGIPAFPFFIFAIPSVIGLVGDVRLFRSGPLQGVQRLTRHLWRMTYALFIAALSFFIGQAKVIPKPIRIMPLLVLPVLAVLVTLIYWLWRVRAKRGARTNVISPSGWRTADELLNTRA